jgi:NHL repeat
MEQGGTAFIPVAIAITMMISYGKQNNPSVNQSNAVVTTLAGPNIGGLITGVDPAPSFNQPNGVAVDNEGNVYVADEGNNMIRKISQ